jgi:outer membrane protein OmpA-like peptidoglycan-associated protein
MKQTQTSSHATAASPQPIRTGAILASLAALFAGGLLLLFALSRNADLSLAGQPTAADQGSPAGDAASVPERSPSAAAQLAALEAQLAATRARLDALATQTQAFADTTARVDTLAAELAAVRGIADAAATRAAEVAQRFGGLAADYAKLGARFTPDGVLIRLDETTLGFPAGSSALPTAADGALAEIAAFLERHPDRRVLLRGHTDATGSATANLALSQARAAAVRDALVTIGIEPARLRVEGVGAAEPVADNATAQGRRQNRRVDILLDLPDAAAGSSVDATAQSAAGLG